MPRRTVAKAIFILLRQFCVRACWQGLRPTSYLSRSLAQPASSGDFDRRVLMWILCGRREDVVSVVSHHAGRDDGQRRFLTIACLCGPSARVVRTLFCAGRTKSGSALCRIEDVWRSIMIRLRCSLSATAGCAMHGRQRQSGTPGAAMRMHSRRSSRWGLGFTTS